MGLVRQFATFRSGYTAHLVLMGLFSEWTLFQAPEVVLERQLQANPYHPFQLASDDVYHSERGNIQPAYPAVGIKVTALH